MKRKQVLRKWRHHLGEIPILWVEICIAGPDGCPLNQLSLGIPSVFKLIVGIDHLGHAPDHQGVELHALPLGKGYQRRHIHLHRQAHDNAHSLDVKLKQILSVPCFQLDDSIFHGYSPLHFCGKTEMQSPLEQKNILHTSLSHQALHGVFTRPRFMVSPPTKYLLKYKFFLLLSSCPRGHGLAMRLANPPRTVPAACADIV